MQRDLDMIALILQGVDANTDTYGVTARRNREVLSGWTRIRGAGGGEHVHQCHLLLLEWFDGPVDREERMPAASRDYLLSHGSYWQEVYVCCVEMQRMPLDLAHFWDWAAYWARAVYCIYLNYRYGSRPNPLYAREAVVLNDFFHFGLHFYPFERRVMGETAGYLQLYLRELRNALGEGRR
eukprot:GHVU01229352.1.p1 GENE.GHVU01229352.1~~GHVU01229352.1.p1  ORF type:complete len:181 (-),score=0.43 GHVU01229352.1:214-756(-)